ncbi:MAG TPA: hypothetical protein VMU80_22950 [Bryobacteraceae bacterium]|nr:hypothetical protein [Bryobacteraceae bacterium]
MLKKLGIPTLLLAAGLMAVPASAAVRFGVGIGGPVYAPAYPYYAYPYYSYPSPYGYPYVYGGWGWHGGWHWHGHYYHHWHRR